MNRIILTLILCIQAISLPAQVTITGGSSRNSFPLVSGRNTAAVCYDADDAITVKTAAELFASDIQKVTGQAPAIISSPASGENIRYAVIAGTIGESVWIDEMIAKGKINVSSIKGGWEQYAVRLVNNPAKGIKKAIVIAGSDRRGTAFGLMSLSRTIGVSPWYWWLDAPVQPLSSINLTVNDFDSKTPSVKYRGIFINDEDWTSTVVEKKL